MDNQALFTQAKDRIWRRMPDFIWRGAGGVWETCVDAVAWIDYRLALIDREARRQLWIATAEGPGNGELAVSVQPQRITGITVYTVLGMMPGDHALHWNAERGTLALGEYPPVDLGGLSQTLDLAPVYEGTLDRDADMEIEAPHFFVNVQIDKLPTLSLSETLAVVHRRSLDYLGKLAKIYRNRERYEDELDTAFRTRVIRGVGRAKSPVSVIAELAQLLGYPPALELRGEEWSGFVTPGMSFIGYSGNTSRATDIQERYYGAHAREKSAVLWRLFVHVRTGDSDKHGQAIDSISRRLVSAGTEIVLVDDL